MVYAQYVPLIILLPLLSFVVLGFWGKKSLKPMAGMVGTTVLLVSCALACYTAYQYFTLNGAYQPVIAIQGTWLEFTPTLSIDMGILLDPASVMMLVVVTFISLMVHLYSMGYMKQEERKGIFFAYLSLFTFSMLGLVISTNIFQIYMFWELVGVSSFLLIGYYYDRPSAVAASKKAFIVTRFADLGFLIGILILGFQAGSLDFQTIIERVTNTNSEQYANLVGTHYLGISLLTWALVLIFMGGAGKSAMFPLHIWLPDAMEGPTPVSALIHAATMVVAGVYLVARLFPLYHLAEGAQNIVMLVGVTSAVFAAIIACTQTDFKRILAFSTMSQIGYMMFALGVSGYGGESGLGFSASLFHLFTHAFFKSLLFLAAGLVIHVAHTNNVFEMGGMRKYAPVAHATFLIACLAIAGIPPFAGFFSKEEILTAAMYYSSTVYVLALITSGLTAFYMFRLYFLVFWHKEASVHSHHSEGCLSQKLPLVLLAIASILAGFVPFSQYVSADNKPFHAELHLSQAIAPVAVALLGISIAFALYKKESSKSDQFARAMGSLYLGARKKFYIDELYLFVTQKVMFNLIGRPAAWIDRNIVDGMVNGMAAATAGFSSAIKGLQSGRVQQYALYFFGGILALALIFLYIWK
jgi:NADH-quinone oxidoreductase subunit L